jgi:hypothetical protein
VPRTLRRQLYDPQAMLACVLAERSCRACGQPAGSAHHLVPRGGPHYGDDVAANLVALCGDGTSGCHGAWHGNPYVYTVNPSWRTGQKPDRPGGVTQRRDHWWVAERIGETLEPDNVDYVVSLLGVEAGVNYLRTRYLYER